MLWKEEKRERRFRKCDIIFRGWYKMCDGMRQTKGVEVLKIALNRCDIFYCQPISLLPVGKVCFMSH